MKLYFGFLMKKNNVNRDKYINQSVCKEYVDQGYFKVFIMKKAMKLYLKKFIEYTYIKSFNLLKSID